MRTKCYNVYKFSELSPEAQAKAIDGLRDINVDHDWWDPEYDHWKEVLKEQGFEDAEISFSGFGSQGDGASFTSRVNLETYLKDKPQYRRIIALVKAGWRIRFSVTRSSSHYSHKYTCHVEDESADIYKDRHTLISSMVSDISKSLEEDRKSLCDDIYEALEKYYDGLTSDEAIKETIQLNDYDFTENGKLD